jgi:hypothetical protein
MSNIERPMPKVGDRVKVTARVDNYGCVGIVDCIECDEKYPISVFFESDDRGGDEYDLPKFNKRACYKDDELELF